MASAHEIPQAGPRYVVRQPSLGERLIAAFAHLLILANLPGFVITGLIVILSRGGSPYIKHHAKSALRWQLFETLLTAGLVAALLAVIVGAGFMGQTRDPGQMLDAAFGAGIGIILVFAIPTVIFAIPAVLGALRALLGGNFRYPVVPPRATPSR